VLHHVPCDGGNRTVKGLESASSADSRRAAVICGRSCDVSLPFFPPKTSQNNPIIEHMESCHPEIIHSKSRNNCFDYFLYCLLYGEHKGLNYTFSPTWPLYPAVKPYTKTYGRSRDSISIPQYTSWQVKTIFSIFLAKNFTISSIPTCSVCLAIRTPSQKSLTAG
jgi:hypothetical protein